MDNNDKQYLSHLRHSCSHLLAAAVLDFWPEAKLTLGPSTDDGFYYDIDFGDDVVSDKEFKKIEQKMKELAKTWEGFCGEELSEAQARELFAGNKYKLELIDGIVERGENITVYRSGKFVDLCRGGHVEDPRKELRHFKLMKIAGAYWRGDEKREMLTRIYGTAFPSKEELKEYLHRLEEAKKRDHRKLGKELDLFVFSPLVGSGLPLFTPKGAMLRELLNDYSQQLRIDKGFEKVWVPHITKKELYETSGHWAKFGDELFLVKSQETSDEMVMKPMNCPHHQQIFAAKMRSYKDLPLKYMETTTIYRDEKAGELLGLSRVRSITQDDSHVFCTPEQIELVYGEMIDIVKTFYDTIGMKLKARISLRDPENPDAYIGDPALWDKAQSILIDIAKKHDLDYYEAEGEAAFYGPKIDFMAMDAIGREWQVATPQLDFVQPQRFGLSYVDSDGDQKTPVMIHFALMGSLERFLSVYIEHTEGKFPVWLSPVQIHFVPVSEKHVDGVRDIVQSFKERGIRVSLDDADETVGKKIRNAVKTKVPYIVVVGDKELDGGDWQIRVRGQEEQLTLSEKDFLKKIETEIFEKHS